LKEIEDIQAGLWDKKIQAELSGEPETLTELPKEENLEKAQPSDEVFDGSELSGVSESAESSSSSQMKVCFILTSEPRNVVLICFRMKHILPSINWCKMSYRRSRHPPRARNKM
jgi:hypothetical protein